MNILVNLLLFHCRVCTLQYDPKMFHAVSSQLHFIVSIQACNTFQKSWDIKHFSTDEVMKRFRCYIIPFFLQTCWAVVELLSHLIGLKIFPLVRTAGLPQSSQSLTEYY